MVNHNDRHLYRVWNYELKQMLYIDPIEGHIEINGHGDYIGLDSPDSWNGATGCELLQCINLRDKNNKPVFEEDIIKTQCGNFLIRYCDNCKQYQLHGLYDGLACYACEGDILWYELLEMVNEQGIEVIGNSFENDLSLLEV